MRNIIGKNIDSINKLVLEERALYYNTLILAESGSGKTNLACRIRNFVTDNDIPTLYLDFQDSHEDEIEIRFKDSNFNYIRFEESEAFDAALDALIAQKKHIYMAVDPEYFSSKKEVKSKLSQTIQKTELLDNYYYFFHDIATLNVFFTKFENFLVYMFGLLNMKKYGMTFLAQPHEMFEDPELKLLFTFLYIGKCSNANYFNTASLRTFPKNQFIYQYRTPYKTLLFNETRCNTVEIDEYVFEE